MAKKEAQSKKVSEKKSSGKKADVFILKRARITEKAAHASGDHVYVFDVALSATKSEIAKAFEMQYKHAPIAVRTSIRKPKAHFRRGAKGATVGYERKLKKAYISLPKGTSIDVM